MQPAWTQMLGIRVPVVAGGMAWCSGARLAAAVSEAGGLGLIGGGSMDEELLRHHIRKARGLTSRPVGVNIPMTFRQSPGLVEVCLQEKVPVIFTSAGNPRRTTRTFKDAGARVFHVVSTPLQGVKAEQAGVDGVVVEGFEAGGHLAHEELTTMVLVPQVVDRVACPVLAAGGIATGRQMAAALALGAAGVQVGTRFALTEESAAHPAYKQLCLQAGFDGTRAVFKKNVPMRMLHNAFRDRISEAEERGASAEEMLALLGEGRPRRGMFEGDLDEGVLEIGQVAGMIRDLPPAAEVVRSLVAEYNTARAGLPAIDP